MIQRRCQRFSIKIGFNEIALRQIHLSIITYFFFKSSENLNLNIWISSKTDPYYRFINQCFLQLCKCIILDPFLLLYYLEYWFIFRISDSFWDSLPFFLEGRSVKGFCVWFSFLNMWLMNYNLDRLHKMWKLFINPFLLVISCLNTYLKKKKKWKYIKPHNL